MKKTAVLLLTLSIGACSDDADVDTDLVANASRTYANSAIVPSCGPADGPAFRLTLSDAPIAADSCSVLIGAARQLEILIYTNEIEAPQTVRFDSFETGFANDCPGGSAPCVLIEAGEIRFETFSNQGASGSWRLEIGDEVETGSFNASFCDPMTLCG